MNHRKFLEGSFQMDTIKSFISIFTDSSNQMLLSLSKIEGQNDTNSSDEINLFKYISKCALTMVLATSFGIKASEVHFDDEILKAIEEYVNDFQLFFNSLFFTIYL